MRYLNKYTLFFESRQTEKQALKHLKDNDVLTTLKEIDKSKNQILIPSMAYFISKDVELNNIEQTFIKIPKLLDRKLITINLTKNGVKVNGQFYTDWLDFSENIDGLDSAINYKDNKKHNKNYQKEFINDDLDKPIWSGNGIRIFDANDVGKCIRLGKGEEFCISQPGNTMYQSYRDSKNSSFYFIYDDNQKDNPLNVVVFDNTKNGIELTDERNVTGNIHKYGRDVNKYIEYLKSKDVPIDKMINVPKSESEIEEEKLIGKLNKNYNWFIDLSPELKSKYIGRGYPLSVKQFDYLIDNNLKDLLKQYINIGKLSNHEIDEVEKIPNLLKSYIKAIDIQLNAIRDTKLKEKEIRYLYKFGYFDGVNVRYPNFKSKEFYKTLINPTLDSLDKHDISIVDVIKYGNVEMSKKLINRGLNKHELMAALDASLARGYVDLAKYLIDKNAPIIKYLYKSLRRCISNGQKDSVDFILKHGNESNLINTGLLLACRGGRLVMVKLLIEGGADINYTNGSPLALASIYGSLKTVEYLISMDVDVTVSGNRAIEAARDSDNMDIVELLKTHGASLNES